MLEDLEAHNVAGIRQALWHPVVQPHSIISHWCYCSQLETVKPCKTSQEAVKVWINCKIYDLSLRIFARLEAAHDRIWPVLIIKSLISYVPGWMGVTNFFFRKTSPIAAQKGGTLLDRIRFHSILEGCSDMAISLKFGVDSVGHEAREWSWTKILILTYLKKWTWQSYVTDLGCLDQLAQVHFWGLACQGSCWSSNSAWLGGGDDTLQLVSARMNAGLMFACWNSCDCGMLWVMSVNSFISQPWVWVQLLFGEHYISFKAKEKMKTSRAPTRKIIWKQLGPLALCPCASKLTEVPHWPHSPHSPGLPL